MCVPEPWEKKSTRSANMSVWKTEGRSIRHEMIPFNCVRPEPAGLLEPNAWLPLLIKSAEDCDRAAQVNLDSILINDKDGDEDIRSTTFEP